MPLSCLVLECLSRRAQPALQHFFARERRLEKKGGKYPIPEERYCRRVLGSSCRSPGQKSGKPRGVVGAGREKRKESPSSGAAPECRSGTREGVRKLWKLAQIDSQRKNKVVVHIAGGADLDALAAHRRAIPSRCLEHLAETAIEMIGERENLLNNRAMLIAWVARVVDCLSRRTALRAVEALVPISRGEIVEATTIMSSREAEDPLNAFKFRPEFCTGSDASSIAIIGSHEFSWVGMNSRAKNFLHGISPNRLRRGKTGTSQKWLPIGPRVATTAEIVQNSGSSEKREASQPEPSGV